MLSCAVPCHPWNDTINLVLVGTVLNYFYLYIFFSYQKCMHGFTSYWYTIPAPQSRYYRPRWLISLPVACTEFLYDTRKKDVQSHTNTHFCSLRSDSSNLSCIDLRECENQTRQWAVNIKAGPLIPASSASTATAVNRNVDLKLVYEHWW